MVAPLDGGGEGGELRARRAGGGKLRAQLLKDLAPARQRLGLRAAALDLGDDPLKRFQIGRGERELPLEKQRTDRFVGGGQRMDKKVVIADRSEVFRDDPRFRGIRPEEEPKGAEPATQDAPFIIGDPVR